MSARLASDVDLDEEAELRRLEGGGGAQAVQFRCQAFGRPGRAHVHPNVVEWWPDGGAADACDASLDIIQIEKLQVAKKNGNAKLRVVMKSGAPAWTFDMTDAANPSGGQQLCDALRDTLAAAMTALAGGSRPTSAMRPPSAGAAAAPPPSPSAGSKRPLPPSDDGGGGGSGGGGSGAAAAASLPLPPPAKRPSPAAASSSSSAAADGLTPTEREAAEARLASDPALRKLYDELVLRVRALSPAEFWAQRRGERYAASQQRGFASATLDDADRTAARADAERVERDVAAAAAAEEDERHAAARMGGAPARSQPRSQPPSQAQGGPSAAATAPGQQVKINLTFRMKLSIFETYPDVQALFLRVVPHEMSERTFWLRYFRSKVKQQHAAAARSSGRRTPPVASTRMWT